MLKSFDAKTLSDGDAEPLNRMEYFVLRRGRVRSPEEHICRIHVHVLLAQEPAASADEDALVDGGQEYLLFDVKDVLGFRVGVLVPVY